MAKIREQKRDERIRRYHNDILTGADDDEDDDDESDVELHHNDILTGPAADAADDVVLPPTQDCDTVSRELHGDGDDGILPR